MIVSAVITDAKEITNIAIKSKAYWQYTEIQLQSWKDDLTVSAKMIKEQNVFKFILNDKIVGFYILNKPKENKIVLEFLFVLPKFIGLGIGTKLIKHSYNEALKYNCNLISLLADPNATNFYKSQGFKVISQKESSISGRFLPIMQKYLK